MKKLAISLFVLFLSFLSFGQSKSIEIGLLLDVRNEIGDSLLLRLKHEISSVVGENTKISIRPENYLTNNYDIVIAKEQYDQLIKSDVDLILALGPVNNLMLHKIESYEKPTILYGTLDQDLYGWDSLGVFGNRDNLSLIIEPASYKNDIQFLHQLTTFKKVGVLVEKPLTKLLPIETTFKSIVSPLNSDYQMIPFNSVQDIISQIDSVDAVYLIGGYFFDQSELALLTNHLNDKKIASFTLNHPDQIRQGFLAGSQSEENVDQIIKRIAVVTDEIINEGGNSNKINKIEYHPQLTINLNTADKIGLSLKDNYVVDYKIIEAFDAKRDTKAYNLQELIYTALNQNLGLQSMKKQVELSAKDVSLSKTNYLPTLTASGALQYTDPDIAELGFGQTPEFQSSSLVTFQQVLFSGEASANIAIQKSLQKAQEEGLDAEKLNTVFEVANLYFKGLIFKSTAQINVSNLDLVKQNHQIALQNFNSGQSSKSDVLRFESQIAQSKQIVLESFIQMDQLKIELNQLLNRDLKNEIFIEDAYLDQGLFSQLSYNQFISTIENPDSREHFISFLIEEAKKNSPELKGFKYETMAVDKGIKLNGANRLLPTVQLSGQYNSIFQRNGEGSTAPDPFTMPDNFYSAGVNVSLPIFNGNRTNLNQQRLKIRKNQIDIERGAFELSLEANIRNTVLNISNQINNMEFSEVSEKSAKKSLEITTDLYANGAVNIAQLIDAQNNYRNSQLARATVTYSYLVNMLQLERQIGYFFLLNTEEENKAFIQRYLEFNN